VLPSRIPEGKERIPEVERREFRCVDLDWYGVAVKSPLLVLPAVLLVAGLGACASAPMYRPVSPPLDDRSFEAGAGVHGVVGQDVAGVGTAAWMQGQVAKDIMLVARGHFTDLFPYRGGGGVFRDVQLGGAAGLRGTYRISEDLVMGGEALIDYQQVSSSVDGTTQYFVSGVAGFPVAEKALDNVWVYVEPQLGAGFRFGDVSEPFSGFMECPIGVAWKVNDWALVVVEGGFAVPFTGGYLGVGGSFRL